MRAICEWERRTQRDMDLQEAFGVSGGVEGQSAQVQPKQNVVVFETLGQVADVLLGEPARVHLQMQQRVVETQAAR